jgi:MFS family permease
MFNVLSALSGGGQVNPATNNNSSTILYSLFAVFSLFSGSVVNYLGPRVTLASGGVGYSLLTVSYWSYNHTANKGFVYFGGAACGVAAAFLWSAEGAMIMSLPLEKDKGKYISIFYGLSFFITVIGAIIPTAENWSITTAGSANDGTYIALFVLMLMGSVVALFVAKPETIFRNDGTRVLIPRQTSMWQELKNLPLAIKREPLIILFFPYAFAGLWYIPYQSNDFNGYFFDLRTRGFASLWYDFGQFATAVLMGYILDLNFLSRRKRAFVGWTFLFVLANAVFIGGVFPMMESHRGIPPVKLLSVGENSKSAGYITLFVFYGCVDGAWQTFGMIFFPF